MLEEANLQIASLMIAIGDTENAKPKLLELLKSEKIKIAQGAKRNLISIALSEKQPDEVERLLNLLEPETPLEHGLQKYLTGRLQLLRGQRLEAGGTFQNLTSVAEDAQPLPSELFHEATLALADSLALEDNEEAGVNSLLQTLEKHPDSPRLTEIFARLKAWSPKIETAPLLAKLSTWVPLHDPNAEPNFRPIPESDSAGGLAEITNQDPLPLRSLHALEFIASTNLKSSDPAVSARGVKQIEQLQFSGEIDTPLINRSLLDLGMAHLKREEFDRAITLFNLLTESSHSPLLKAYARTLSGQASFAKEKPEDASEAFLEAAKIAARLRNTSLRATSELNAGISLLDSTKSKDLDELTGKLQTPEAKSFLILERGLFLNSQNDPAARDLLASFINDFPSSPRKDEALLALAESSIFAEPDDPHITEFIKREASSLKFDFETQALLEVRRIIAFLKLGEAQGQATDFIRKNPDHPFSPRILFQLGQTQRAAKDIAKANITFKSLLKDYPDSEFADISRFLSAKSSAALGIETGEKQAIAYFQELIEGKGVLAIEAAISQASLLIDREQPDDARQAIEKISSHLAEPTLNDSDRRRLLILKADAFGQLGKHEDALSSYADLLNIKNLPDSTRNRASFHMGEVYERLGRKADALESYLSVVNRDFDPKKTTSLEWKWFDKCGLEGALPLLEGEKRWRAAISLAEKLGKSGSPRAKDAQESAARIGLEQRIWRDR